MQLADARERRCYAYSGRARGDRTLCFWPVGIYYRTGMKMRTRVRLERVANSSSHAGSRAAAWTTAGPPRHRGTRRPSDAT